MPTEQIGATRRALQVHARSVGAGKAESQAAALLAAAGRWGMRRTSMQPRKFEDPGSYVPSRPPVQRTLAEAFAFVRPPWGLRVSRTAPRLDGRPVLVLPVTGRADAHTAQIRARLDALGCRTFGWGLGTNYGPTPDILRGIERRLLTLHAQHGAMTVIGFSLGGIFARRLSHLHPDEVREVITVCSLSSTGRRNSHLG